MKIEEYLPFADYLARNQAKKLPRHIHLDELKSAAYLGLVEAARKYDSAICPYFKSYASRRINGAIIDYLRELEWGNRSRHADIAYITDIDIENGNYGLVQ